MDGYGRKQPANEPDFFCFFLSHFLGPFYTISFYTISLITCSPLKKVPYLLTPAFDLEAVFALLNGSLHNYLSLFFSELVIKR